MLTNLVAYRHGRGHLVTEEFEDYFDPHRAAVVSIDMHRSHLDDPVHCPCPGPRGRAVIGDIDGFHRRARTLGVPIIHVRTWLRRGGVDDAAGNRASWRRILRWSGEAGP